jgi:shikimate kinase
MRYCVVNSRSKSIVLIGMMGAGKSSVGCCLQRRTKLALIDTDEIVASKFGISIPEIFSKYGEQTFREAETQVLREMAPAKQSIIVTGGGIVLREENVNFLKRLDRCCSARIHQRRSRECYRRGCHFMPKLQIFASTHRCSQRRKLPWQF